MQGLNVSDKSKKGQVAGDGGIGINDLPEIQIIVREIERFKKTMLQNPPHEEEESPRGVAERHFLNGLERAKEILALSHYENRKAF